MIGSHDVSVVMPVGSVEPELQEQLAALAEQSFNGSWELVISLNTADPVDRVALDAALDLFRVDAVNGPPVNVVDSSSVRSASHARNVGAQAAKAPFLAFCDSDDIADPHWLENIVDALGAGGAVGGYLEEERLAISGQENWRPPATPGGNPTFLGHPYLVSANMGVDAEAFRLVGGFDESLIRGEDIAFAWSLIRSDVALGYASGAVMHYRHRKGLWPMLKQHYLYGRGMSQILSRQGVPDTSAGNSGLLRANGQRVEQMNAVHVLRRGSIALGRLLGLAIEAVPNNSDRTSTSGRK